MKIHVLLTFLFVPVFVVHSIAQEGAFNTNTGEELSKKGLKAILPDSFYLFAKEEPLELTIESNFKNLRKRKYDAKYQEAMLSYQLNDSILIKRQIKVKARGEIRKKICYFPPIKVNLKKTKFYVQDLKDLEKMKMVTRCNGRDRYETYLLKEYLIYKIYNLFTEKSFKTRLLKVKFIDTGRRKVKKMETFAFVIEEADKMAARNGGGVVRQMNISQTSCERAQIDLVAMFQYMIGNTDWSVPGQHNLKLIQRPGTFGSAPAPEPVPYDFDYTGFVNAEYAIPIEALGIESVRERIFQGYCRTEEEYQATIDIFLENEQAIYDLINDFDYLRKKDKKDVLNYIELFYQQVKKTGTLERQFKRTCKK